LPSTIYSRVDVNHDPASYPSAQNLLGEARHLAEGMDLGQAIQRGRGKVALQARPGDEAPLEGDGDGFDAEQADAPKDKGEDGQVQLGAAGQPATGDGAGI